MSTYRRCLEFFARVAEILPDGPAQTLYVGDHRDNDVVAAKAAGFKTALIKCGPWGYLWADDPLVRRDEDWVIDSWLDLPDLLRPQPDAARRRFPPAGEV
ncbi:HAD family hydrolase [Amycolatopsis sp. WAC 01376]|uniref:HAD family hydrolase n=1 Tax=Amycolatopsis sp. WAC 01376 TaxID=2203195 RepID=UPI001F19BFF8|nr:HAD hydrolase-like protein [Amycolatopsis sp. WAC 01376]